MSNTRCEGCEQSFCLPCMNKHHDGLMTEFEMLFGVRNDLKESLNMVESNWRNKKEFPCFDQINQWEQEMIIRVQQTAANARSTANDMMAQNLSDIHRKLEQLTSDMQKRLQDGNYLDNDVNDVRNQLEKLNTTIKQANEKVRIHYLGMNKINWNSLLCVKMEMKQTSKKITESHANFTDFVSEEPITQEKIWKNIKKLIKYRKAKYEIKDQNSTSNHSLSQICESNDYNSISTLTSPYTPRWHTYSITNISDRSQQNFCINEASYNYVTFKLSDYEQLLPSGSEA